MLKHISFEKGKKTIAILLPTRDLDKGAIQKHYVDPLTSQGIPASSIVAVNIVKNQKGKAPAKLINHWIDVLTKLFEKENIKTLLICDPAYFKKMCKVTKVEMSYGYAKETPWKGISGFICPNYKSLFYNPYLADKISFSLNALSKHVIHNESLFKESIVRHPEYPTTNLQIDSALDEYSKYEQVTCDIETYSLKVDKAGLATISFAKDKTSGMSFAVGNNELIRQKLKDFFINYKGTLIFHGSTYDCKVLIWELFMQHPRDYEGMLQGLHILFRDLEDTKILAYLALNTTAKISLSLKDLSFEYAGNYALANITDITKHTKAELLKYNLEDAVCTWYVYDKYREEVRQTQEDVYQTVFLPALKTITQMELCGVPINLGKVLNVEHQLDDIAIKHRKAIMQHPIIHAVTDELRDLKAKKATEKLKKLVKTREDFLSFEFNPESSDQLGFLLHNYLGLPILNTTDTGKPATGAKALEALCNNIENGSKYNKDYIPLIRHIIELGKVSKILNTFIPAFKNNSISKDAWEYLHGSFNLGIVKSGRLSSSDPNLQNIPSTGTVYAKPIKECFQAPPFATDDEPKGWLLVGADYDALEDKVSALLTKDPNKLAIYTDGYDGHCLRAYSYFGDQMPDIDPTSVSSINSIATRREYKEFRQLSKSPTFLLTYMGTAAGLRKTFGFDTETAKKIEKNYHDLYKVSDEWVMDRIREASKTGYVELAFGLRLRTPMLPQVVIGSDSLPQQAHKEIKTAGNALGQSYGLLNTHSANMFMDRVHASKYATKVLPCMHIHDSQYYMVQNTLGCLKWVNDNLIECMEWNDLAPIQHPTIKLSASLEVFYPTWASSTKVPNKASLSDIKTLFRS